MDRHLIPFLQVAINEVGNSVKELELSEYCFSFVNRKDKDCLVTMFFDSACESVCMRQTYDGPNDHEDDDDISLEGFVKYIS